MKQEDLTSKNLSLVHCHSVWNKIMKHFVSVSLKFDFDLIKISHLNIELLLPRGTGVSGGK